MKSSLSEQQRFIRNIYEDGKECLHEGGRLGENKR